MDILIVMCIGILVGRVSILRRAKKKNESFFVLYVYFDFFYGSHAWKERSFF